MINVERWNRERERFPRVLENMAASGERETWWHPWFRDSVRGYLNMGSSFDRMSDRFGIQCVPRAIITRRLFSPSRRKIGRGDQPINRMDRFSPRQTERERDSRHVSHVKWEQCWKLIDRDRERERGSVEDGDDRLHKRLERESLRRGFCARVPDGWRHCRALKNTPRVGGVQLSPLFSIFIPSENFFFEFSKNNLFRIYVILNSYTLYTLFSRKGQCSFLHVATVSNL